MRPIPTPIYHITHVRNLRSIIESGGLVSDSHLSTTGLVFTGIAHQDIKQKRALKIVPVSERGTLANYVPFYFANRSPMLYTIQQGNVEGYTEGQEPIIYLCTTADAMLVSEKQCCFTNGHALEELSDFFEDIDDLERIDWEVIRSWSWRNRENDPDRKRRKQAEFLIYDSVSIAMISQIAVMNEKMEARVRAILELCCRQVPVKIERKWYYD